MLRFRQLSLAAVFLPLFATALLLFVPWLWPEPNKVVAVAVVVLLLTQTVIFFGGLWATIIAFIAIKKEAPDTYRYRDHWFGVWTKKHLDHKNFCGLVWGLGILTMVALFLITLSFAVGVASVLWSLFKGVLFFAAIIVVLAGGTYLLDRYSNTLISWTHNRYVSAMLSVAQKLVDKTSASRQRAQNFVKRKSVCPTLDVH